MTNKFDLDTYMLNNDAVSMISNIGGQIPVGKTRFLTYIRVERFATDVDAAIDLTDIEVAVGSCVTGAADIVNAGSVASYHAKLILKIVSISTEGARIKLDPVLVRNEVKGSIEEPILSVAGGNYMPIAVVGECASAMLFAQYFDA